MCPFALGNDQAFSHGSYGSFALMETESGMDSNLDSNLDSKPNGYIVLCRTLHIAQTRTSIPTPYFLLGRESESQSVPESLSYNVNEPLNNKIVMF